MSKWQAFKEFVYAIRIIIIMIIISGLFIQSHEGIHQRIFQEANCPYNSFFNVSNFAFQVSAECGENSTDLTNIQLANFNNEIAAYNIGTPLLIVIMILFMIIGELKYGNRTK